MALTLAIHLALGLLIAISPSLTPLVEYRDRSRLTLFDVPSAPVSKPPVPDPAADSAAPRAASKATALSVVPALESERPVFPSRFASSMPMAIHDTPSDRPAEADANTQSTANQRSSSEFTASASRDRANAGEDTYGMQVHRWIERRKSYPAAIAGRGLEGTVVVAFELDRHGRLCGRVQIVQSSGERLLDMLAQQQLAAAEPFPRAPHDAGWRRRSFTILLTYRPAG